MANDSKTPKLGTSQVALIIEKYMANKMNLLLTGMPGIGKTDIVKQVSKRLNYDLVIFHPVISDPTDFKGFPWCFTDASGKEHAVFVPFDQLKALIGAKKNTICFLDDFGQAPAAVQAACMQLIHGGNIAGHKISDHVSFLACTNRKQDRAAVTGILEPVKSRFHGIFELIPEIEPFRQWLIANRYPAMLAAFVAYRPNWIQGGDDGWKPSAEIVNQPCPRTIAHLGDVIKLNLPREVVKQAYAGAVGPSMAQDYMSFERLASQLPDIKMVFTNPDLAEIPDKPDIKFAMIGALHHNMNTSNLANVYRYVERAFPKELQMVFHMDIKNYNPALTRHNSHIQWAADNGDLLSN